MLEGGWIRTAALAAALAVAACWAPAAALAQSAAAGLGHVGLEARGIDAWTALRYCDRLDVRDAFNRPVSRALIEREARAASAEAALAASVSRLPFFPAVARSLESLVSLASCLRGGNRAPAPPAVAALPWSLRPQPRLLLAALFAFLLASSLPPLSERACAARRPGSCRPVVLRC